jgi:hypothetical protein
MLLAILDLVNLDARDDLASSTSEAAFWFIFLVIAGTGCRLSWVYREENLS